MGLNQFQKCQGVRGHLRSAFESFRLKCNNQTQEASYQICEDYLRSFTDSSARLIHFPRWCCFRAITPRALRVDSFRRCFITEYSPTDRLDKDIRLMKAANITVARIAESTWGTLEPQEGVFNFSHVDCVLNAMDKAGIKSS